MFNEAITFDRLEVQHRSRAPRAFKSDRSQLSGGAS
jgi:hypothetical protein